MQAHTVERVESWDSRPFSDGFRELHGLADREFSGAVVADGTWLFMLNGRVTGVFEGEIEDFGDASGTVYEAPDSSVALLFSMQERGGKTQAKYYTNDTPLSEADQTLADANFTGYIELSENVLSGDYYVVYYGGRSMSAAFVGTTEDLLTGDEAFERADDEVGVYEVLKTPVNVTTIPEVDDGNDAAGGAAGAGATAGGASAADDAGDNPGASDQNPDDATGGSSSETGSDSSSEPVDESAGPTGEPTVTEAESRTSSGSANDTAGGGTAAAGRNEAAGETSDVAAGGNPSNREEDARPDSSQTASSARSTGSSGGDGAESGTPADAAGDETGDEGERAFNDEKEWRNATSVPTLDPEKSESTDGGAKSSNATTNRSQKRSKTTTSSSKSGQSSSKRGQSSSKSGQSSSRSDANTQSRSTVEKLKVAVKRRDAKLEEASEHISDLESERDDLQARVESLQSERDDLRERANDLQTQLDAAEQREDTAAASSGPDLTPAAALSGTNLFVRYGSKGKATLDGLDGSTDPDAVNENLRVDHHTQFDATEATVDGEDYETFLESTGAYRFVSWAVRELPYEVRDAGHANDLQSLYGAIPDVDRAELDGTVEVETDDATTTQSFDVVLRDRMGEPLVVAELNAKREPVTGVEMDDLVDAATTVREGVDELSAAMYVTASFFEPAALETAAEATSSGGFFSRSDRKSFVNVGRKAGYHLCLAEDRNDAFHLTVPEL